MTRSTIRFLRNGQPVEVTDVAPMETVLDYLRLREGSVGTKEGCGEGDCGACTVALGRIGPDGTMRYQPVNACILLLGQIDGGDLITVDDLSTSDGPLHPVQDAMVRHHGSQCGFCTPGIVMSLFTLYQTGRPVTRAAVDDWLAGNLCRCTGYAPIAAAALASCGGAPADSVAAGSAVRTRALTDLRDGDDVFIGSDESFLAAPASEATLANLLARHSDAIPVAGATDVGLWITKQLRTLPKIVLLGRVAGFDRVVEARDHVELGAGATYAGAEEAVTAIDPDLGELWRRIGSKQVRASGTVGGNIANGSPIGDTPPALIALGATLALNGVGGARYMALEDFFVDYGKQDRQPGEYVSAVRIPRLTPGQFFRCFKISKRFDQDISAVMAAFRMTVKERRITEARIAFGGMAAIPKRADRTEAVVAGLSLDAPESWTAATEMLGADFAPIDDMRASAAYRLNVAKGVLLKCLTEIAGETTVRTRLVGRRETGEGAHVQRA